MPKSSPTPGPETSPETERRQRERGVNGACIETVPTKTRRRYSASEKLRIVTAADAALAGLSLRLGVDATWNDAGHGDIEGEDVGRLAPGGMGQLTQNLEVLLSGTRRSQELDLPMFVDG